MKKFVVTMTDEMKEELEKISDETGIPIARLVRDGIKLILAQYDVEIDTIVKRGGYRGDSTNSS